MALIELTDPQGRVLSFEWDDPKTLTDDIIADIYRQLSAPAAPTIAEESAAPIEKAPNAVTPTEQPELTPFREPSYAEQFGKEFGIGTQPEEPSTTRGDIGTPETPAIPPKPYGYKYQPLEEKTVKEIPPEEEKYTVGIPFEEELQPGRKPVLPPGKEFEREYGEIKLPAGMGYGEMSPKQLGITIAEANKKQEKELRPLTGELSADELMWQFNNIDTNEQKIKWVNSLSNKELSTFDSVVMPEKKMGFWESLTHHDLTDVGHASGVVVNLARKTYENKYIPYFSLDEARDAYLNGFIDTTGLFPKWQGVLDYRRFNELGSKADLTEEESAELSALRKKQNVPHLTMEERNNFTNIVEMQNLSAPVIGAGIKVAKGLMRGIAKTYFLSHEHVIDSEIERWKKYGENHKDDEQKKNLSEQQITRLKEAQKDFEKYKSNIAELGNRIENFSAKAEEVLDPMQLRELKYEEEISNIARVDNDSARALREGKLGFVLDKFLYQSAASGNEELYDKAINLRKLYDQAVQDIYAGKEMGALKKIWIDTMRMLPPMIESGAWNIVPGVGKYIAMSQWAQQGAGSVLYELDKKGIRGDDAFMLSTLGGVLYAAVEQLQFGQITKAIAGKSIGRVLAAKGIHWATEVGEEALQRLTTDITEDIVKNVRGIDPKTFNELLDRYLTGMIEEAGGAAGPMAIYSLIGIGGNMIGVGARKVSEAGTPEAQFERAVKKWAATTRKKTPAPAPARDIVGEEINQYKEDLLTPMVEKMDSKYGEDWRIKPNESLKQWTDRAKDMVELDDRQEISDVAELVTEYGIPEKDAEDAFLKAISEAAEATIEVTPPKVQEQGETPPAQPDMAGKKDSAPGQLKIPLFKNRADARKFMIEKAGYPAEGLSEQEVSDFYNANSETKKVQGDVKERITQLFVADGLSTEEAQREVADMEKRLSPMQLDTISNLGVSALRDKLTGAYSRLWYDSNKSKQVGEEQVAQKLFMVDLDEFKKVNDTYGHKAGDVVLQEFISILQDNMRGKADVSRIGGEEVAITFDPKVSETDIARSLGAARRQLHDTEFDFTVDNVAGKLKGQTFSAGYGYDEKSADRTYEIADEQLYMAKDAGRKKTFIGGEEYGKEQAQPGKKREQEIRPSAEREVPAATEQTAKAAEKVKQAPAVSKWVEEAPDFGSVQEAKDYMNSRATDWSFTDEEAQDFYTDVQEYRAQLARRPAPAPTTRVQKLQDSLAKAEAAEQRHEDAMREKYGFKNMNRAQTTEEKARGRSLRAETSRLEQRLGKAIDAEREQRAEVELRPQLIQMQNAIEEMENKYGMDRSTWPVESRRNAEVMQAYVDSMSDAVGQYREAQTGKEKVLEMLDNLHRDNMRVWNAKRHKAINRGMSFTTSLPTMPKATYKVPTTAEEKFIVELGKQFGYNATLFESSDPELKTVAGAVWKGSPRDIFINARHKNNLAYLLIHEVLHQLSINNIELYVHLSNQIFSNLDTDVSKMFRKWLEAKYGKEISDSINSVGDIDQEFLAEFIESHSRRKGFWRALADVAGDAVREFLRIFKNIIGRFTSEEADIDLPAAALDKMFQDPIAVRDLIITALAEQAKPVSEQRSIEEMKKVIRLNMPNESAKARRQRLSDAKALIGMMAAKDTRKAPTVDTAGFNFADSGDHKIIRAHMRTDEQGFSVDEKGYRKPQKENRNPIPSGRGITSEDYANWAVNEPENGIFVKKNERGNTVFAFHSRNNPGFYDTDEKTGEIRTAKEYPHRLTFSVANDKGELYTSGHDMFKTKEDAYLAAIGADYDFDEYITSGQVSYAKRGLPEEDYKMPERFTGDDPAQVIVWDLSNGDIINAYPTSADSITHSAGFDVLNEKEKEGIFSGKYGHAFVAYNMPDYAEDGTWLIQTQDNNADIAKKAILSRSDGLDENFAIINEEDRKVVHQRQVDNYNRRHPVETDEGETKIIRSRKPAPEEELRLSGPQTLKGVIEKRTGQAQPKGMLDRFLSAERMERQMRSLRGQAGWKNIKHRELVEERAKISGLMELAEHIIDELETEVDMKTLKLSEAQLKKEVTHELQTLIRDYANMVGLHDRRVENGIVKAVTVKRAKDVLDRIDKYVFRKHQSDAMNKARRTAKKLKGMLKRVMAGKDKQRFTAESADYVSEFIEWMSPDYAPMVPEDIYYRKRVQGQELTEKEQRFLDIYEKMDSPEDVSEEDREWWFQQIRPIPEKLNAQQIDLAVEQVKEVYRLGKTIRQMQIDAAQQRTANKVGEIITEIGQSIPGGLEEEGTLVERAKKKTDEQRKRGRALFEAIGALPSSMLTPETLGETMTDGYVLFGMPKGAVSRYIVDPLIKASQAQAVNLQKHAQRMRETFKNVDMSTIDMDLADSDGKPIQFSHQTYDNEGNPLERVSTTFTLTQAAHIYANSKNARNRAHLSKMGIDAITLAQINDSLPSNVKTAVDEWIDFYDNEMYPRVSEIFQRTYGIPMTKEPNYFPIMRLDIDTVDKNQVIDLMMRNGTLPLSVYKKFVKQRTGSKAPFADFDFWRTIRQHMRHTEHYIAYEETVNEVNPLIRNKGVLSAMRQKNRDNADRIVDWVNELITNEREKDIRGWEKVYDELIKNYVFFALGINPKVILKQLGSIPMGLVYSGNPYYVARGVMKFIQNPNEGVKFVLDNSDLMKSRQGRLNRELEDFRKSKEFLEMSGATKGAKAKAWMQDALMGGIRGADAAVVYPLWMGSYQAEYMKNLDKGRDEAHKMAVAHADQVIQRTQPTGGKEHLPEALRGRGWWRMIGIFKNVLSKQYNIAYMLQRAVRYADMPPDKKAGLLMANAIAYVMSALWMYLIDRAFLRGAIFTKAGDALDEMKDDWGTLAKYLADQALSGFLVLGDFAGYGIQMAANEVRHAKGMDRVKTFAPTHGLSFEENLEDLFNAGVKAAEAMKNIDDMEYEKAIENGTPLIQALGETGAMVTGLFPGQLIRSGMGAYRVFKGGDPSKPENYLNLFYTESALQDRSMKASMAKRLVSPKGWGDRVVFLKWYNSLPNKKQERFKEYVDERVIEEPKGIKAKKPTPDELIGWFEKSLTVKRQSLVDPTEKVSTIKTPKSGIVYTPQVQDNGMILHSGGPLSSYANKAMQLWNDKKDKVITPEEYATQIKSLRRREDRMIEDMKSFGVTVAPNKYSIGVE